MDGIEMPLSAADRETNSQKEEAEWTSAFHGRSISRESRSRRATALPNGSRSMLILLFFKSGGKLDPPSSCNVAADLQFRVGTRSSERMVS